MNQETFVDRLKQARAKKKMTLKELAEACGVSLSAMNRYAAYTAQPGLEVACRMAKALDVSLDWLCGAEERKAENGQATTGNIMRTLSFLLTTPTIDTDCAASFRTYQNGTTYIGIDQECIPQSIDFESWGKFIDLYRNGTIDKDMYTAWLDRKAGELDRVLLPRVNNRFTAVETDELPF